MNKIVKFPQQEDNGIVCNYYAISQKALNLVDDIYENIATIHNDCVKKFGY